MKKLFILIVLISFLSCDSIVDEWNELRGLRTEKVSDTLPQGVKMGMKKKIVSKNKTYQFKVNVYGNLVLKNYKTQEKLWSFETNENCYLIIENDGSLNLKNDSKVFWTAPNSENSQSDRLKIQSNGAVILYAGNTKVWSLNEPSVNPEPQKEFEVHFIGEENYFHKYVSGGSSDIEIDGYPSGAEISDVSLITVLSSTTIATPAGYELLISKSINSLMPSYIDSGEISDSLMFTQFYSVVINPYGGSCVLKSEGSMIIYTSLVRGEVTEKN